MHLYTKPSSDDTTLIRIRTSADGLAGIPAEEYGDKILDMLIEAYPNARVDLEIDERSDCRSQVWVSGIPSTEQLEPAVEREMEERALDIVKHEAFEACCESEVAS